MCFRTNILDAEIWQWGIVAYGFRVPLTTLKALQGRLQVTLQTLLRLLME